MCHHCPTRRKQDPKEYESFHGRGNEYTCTYSRRKRMIRPGKCSLLGLGLLTDNANEAEKKRSISRRRAARCLCTYGRRAGRSSTYPTMWAPAVSRSWRKPVALIRWENVKSQYQVHKNRGPSGIKKGDNPHDRRRMREKSDLLLGSGRRRRLPALGNLTAARGKRGIASPETVCIRIPCEHSR